MENVVRVNLVIPNSEADFMLSLLFKFKKKKMVNYAVEVSSHSVVEESLALDGPMLSDEELLRISKEVDKEPEISYQELKAMFGI